MANEEQLAILRQGVEVWNAWRKEHWSNVIDLFEADLFEADLRGAHLEGAHLEGAHLERAKLFGTDLRGAHLERAHLERVHLERVHLTGADLTGADLTGADLTGAILYRANLQGTYLTEAHLTGVNLQGADLTEAHLQGAILYRADLRGANLHGTNLHGANMRESMVGRTVFVDVDLQGVQGLDMVVHGGPSSIGIDTIYRSEVDIPEGFLRGCGVPDPMIEYTRSLVLAARPIDYYSCFISYSHADTSFARRLHDALQGRGIRCWLDEHQLLPGHSIYDEIDRGIRLWDKILLCASESSLKSWWVDNELNKAFTKEQQFMKQQGSKIRALIPLNLDGALWQWQDGKADEVRSRLAADFTGWKRNHAKFEREFERLVKALQTNEGHEEPPKPKL